MTAAVTTTIDRLGEITAIFEDLERRRLEAIYTGDVEAFTALFANDEFLAASMSELDLVAVTDPDQVRTLDIDVRKNESGCIAARITRDYTEAIEDGGMGSAVYVIEYQGEHWALSWVGEGWECDGSHPLSP